MKKILITAAVLLAAFSAKAQDTIPKPKTQILDRVGLLKTEEKKTIQELMDGLYASKQGKAYLLVIDSIPPGQNILSYTKGIFKKWELNYEEEGLNFIIIYSLKEHAVRIEGSDKVIEITTKQYLQDVTTISMMPYFRKRQDFEALRRGMDMVIKKLVNN